jgi:tRNA G10  N-methylase Trm11
MKLGRQLNILKQLDEGYNFNQVASFSKLEEARIRDIYESRAEIFKKAFNCCHKEYFEPVNICVSIDETKEKQLKRPKTEKSYNNPVEVEIEKSSLISTLKQELDFRKRKIDQVEQDLKFKDNQIKNLMDENNQLKAKLVEQKQTQELIEENRRYLNEINQLKVQLKQKNLKIDRLKIEKQIFLGEHMRIWNENKKLKFL